MRTQLVAVVATLTASLAAAQVAGAVDVGPAQIWQEDPTTIFDAAEVQLDDFRWIARPVVVFSDSPADPAYQRQVDLIEARIDELVRRDVVVILDAEPEARSDARRRLRPRGFTLAILNKEGAVALRKPSPWDVREITRSIDKTPERQQELRERRETLTD